VIGASDFVGGVTAAVIGAIIGGAVVWGATVYTLRRAVPDAVQASVEALRAQQRRDAALRLIAEIGTQVLPEVERMPERDPHWIKGTLEGRERYVAVPDPIRIWWDVLSFRVGELVQHWRSDYDLHLDDPSFDDIVQRIRSQTGFLGGLPPTAETYDSIEQLRWSLLEAVKELDAAARHVVQISETAA
jgi:hypothetical protein